MTPRDDGHLVLTEPIEGGIYIRSNYLMEYPEHPVKSQLVERVHAHEKGKGRIQAAGQTNDELFGAGSLHAARQPRRLDIENFLCAGCKFVLIVRHERMPGVGSLELG